MGTALLNGTPVKEIKINPSTQRPRSKGAVNHPVEHVINTGQQLPNDPEDLVIATSKLQKKNTYPAAIQAMEFNKMTRYKQFSLHEDILLQYNIRYS